MYAFYVVAGPVRRRLPYIPTTNPFAGVDFSSDVDVDLTGICSNIKMTLSNLKSK